MRQILMIHFRAIFNSSEDPNTAVSQPVLQCVQVKPLAGQQGAPERFRVVFSDINNFVQSMLATRKHSQLYSLNFSQQLHTDGQQKQIMWFMMASSEKAVSYG